jgi:hypothetical protein
MPNIDPKQPNSKGKTIKDYLPLAAKMLLGKENPKEGPVESAVENEQYVSGKPAIDKKKLEEVITILKDYKAGKANLEARIVEEERWWKLRHWDVIKGKHARETGQNPEEARPEPTSAWMFNSISNKHADIMDNYPEPNVLPREMADENDAKTLSSILPVVFERNEYEETYDKAAWYKLKHGVVAKGVFWNKELENGLGDIDIRFMDILNIFWEPGITDLQKSRNLFVIDLKDNDLLEQEYPQLKNKLGGQIIEAKQYVHDDNVDVSKKSVVVDWYYKKRTPKGKTILHYCKFCGSEVLFASENEPENYPNGFYDHGKYPVRFDVLFPEEGTPVGFGYIALMKSPQLYIDKLSQVILENSMMSAKVHYLVKKNSGINEDEFLDWSKPVVYYEGDPNNIIPLQVQQVGGSVLNMLQMKIDELKETSSNRDVSQGSSSGGVTAAAAIAALQEAGNKTSRDMIAAAYRSYTQECYLAIELIRQFYDEMRTFRIVGEKGGYEYVQYSNANIKGVPVAPYLGQEMQPGYEQTYRVPVFDVVVKPQKRSPYSKMAQNELAKELYQMGFFNPQLAEQVLTALEMMDFDGEEKVKEKVQQGQTLMNQLIAMEQQLMELATLVAAERGMPVNGEPHDEGKAPAGVQKVPQGKSMGSAATDAQKGTMTSYGRELAERAKPSLENA